MEGGLPPRAKKIAKVYPWPPNKGESLKNGPSTLMSKYDFFVQLGPSPKPKLWTKAEC